MHHAKGLPKEVRGFIFTAKVMFSAVPVCQSVFSHLVPTVQGPAPHLPYMFKFVQYVARTVGKQAVSIRLKCLLVGFTFRMELAHFVLTMLSRSIIGYFFT